MTMAPSCNSSSIALRLEGGLGDHILGMRVLAFVRRAYLSHDIVVYSDCAGHPTPLEVVAMSPLVRYVVPIFRSAAHQSLPRTSLLHLSQADLDRMRSADLLIDAHGDLMYVEAARQLNVPIFELLASRPLLQIASADEEEADAFLRRYTNATLVGVNLSKYGGAFLWKYDTFLRRVIDLLLSRPDVFVLNFFTSSYSFDHWPKHRRTHRENAARTEAEYLRYLCSYSKRILACADLRLGVVAALLKRCVYFVGVDNGIKHLAWALSVEHTLFHPFIPHPSYVLRWVPDVDRLLAFDCPIAAVDRQLAPLFLSTSH